MKIIDAHLHFSAIQKFNHAAKTVSHVDYSNKGLQQEFQKNKIIRGIAMGLTENTPDSFPDRKSPNPMGLDLESAIPDNLHCCIGINPHELESNRQQIKIQKKLEDHSVVGIKLYPGYYPYTVTDPVYQPVYEWASHYDVPIVIHCGDTFFDRGRLRYSHPIHVNQAADKYPEIRLVIAHLGNPWVVDAGVIISNNPNVYADLSGFFLGDQSSLTQRQQEPLLMNHLKTGILYCEHYDKLLFGSDWPLVQLAPYIHLVRQLIPPEYHEDVFYNNAAKVFTRLASFLE